MTDAFHVVTWNAPINSIFSKLNSSKKMPCIFISVKLFILAQTKRENPCKEIRRQCTMDRKSLALWQWRGVLNSKNVDNTKTIVFQVSMFSCVAWFFSVWCYPGVQGMLHTKSPRLNVDPMQNVLFRDVIVKWATLPVNIDVEILKFLRAWWKS